MHYSLRINLGVIPKGLYVYSEIQSIVLFWQLLNSKASLKALFTAALVFSESKPLKSI